MDEKNKKSISVEINEFIPRLSEEFKREPFITVGPKKYVFPQAYKDYADDIYSLDLKPDDTFIVGLPRTGTNLTQEMVWLLNNDINFKKALTMNLRERCPFLEAAPFYLNPKTIEWFETLDIDNKTFFELTLKHPRDLLESRTPPRTVKTHIPLSLLPPYLLDTAKVVYVARDPRDVAVSSYHLWKNSLILEYACDFKTFFDFFIHDCVLFAPYFEHVKEAWIQRNNPNMLFLFYEELRKDLPSVVRRIAKFIDKQYTDDQFLKLCDHLSFDSIKKNKQVNIEAINMIYSVKPDDKVNSFIRKGKAGGWRDYFDNEMTLKAQKWMEENLRDSDLRYPHVN